MAIEGVAGLAPQMAFAGHGGTDLVSSSFSTGYVVAHENAHKVAAEMVAVAAGGRAEVEIDIQFAIVNGRLVATGGETRSRTVIDKKVAEGSPVAEAKAPLEGNPPEKEAEGPPSETEQIKSKTAESEITNLKQKMQSKNQEAEIIETRIATEEDPAIVNTQQEKLRQVKGEAQALRSLVQLKEAQSKIEETMKKMITADQKAFGRILGIIVSAGFPNKGAALDIAA